MREGFTLIELLVAVLIIGILSAIALPQYQLAVGKSRAGQAYSVLKSLADAQQRHLLATGDYAASFGDLDVSMDSCTTAYCIKGNYRYQLYTSPQRHVTAYWGGDLDSIGTNIALSYFFGDPLPSSAYFDLGITKGYWFCQPRNKPQWMKVCESLAAGSAVKIENNQYYWR